MQFYRLFSLLNPATTSESAAKVTLRTFKAKQNKYLCKDDEDADEIDRLLDEAMALFSDKDKVSGESKDGGKGKMCDDVDETTEKCSTNLEVSIEGESTETRYTYESDWESTEVSDSEDENESQGKANHNKVEDYFYDNTWPRKRRVTFRTPLTSTREFVQEPYEFNQGPHLIVVGPARTVVQLRVPRKRVCTPLVNYPSPPPPSPNCSDLTSSHDDVRQPSLSSVLKPAFDLFSREDKPMSWRGEPKGATTAAVVAATKRPRSSGLRASLKASANAPVITNVLDDGGNEKLFTLSRRLNLTQALHSGLGCHRQYRSRRL